MLQLIRSRVTSIFVKVLFAVLILSFAVWGIGDIFRGGFSGRSAVTVGEVEIGPVEILERFDRARQNFSRRVGQAISVREAAEFGILDAVIDEAVVDGLFAAEADRLGLAVSEDTIGRKISESPAFRDQLGQFNAAQFRQALFNAGISEAEFVQMMRRDVQRQQITNAITAGAAPLEPLEAALYQFRMTRRVASVVSIPFAAVTDVPEPTDADLRAYHEENAEEFRVPTTRSVTYVELLPDDLAAEILVPEDTLREEYDIRVGEFTVEERRTIEQAFFPDEDAARAAHERIVSGEDFAAVAADATGTSADALSLGTLRRGDLPEQTLADAAFGLAAGEVSGPVESALGWHILRVTEIEPETVRPFEAVREEIRADLARTEAIDALYGLSTDLEDTLAGGATLEEAAAQLRLEIKRVERLAEDGTDGKGGRHDGLPATRAFVELAFDTEIGVPSVLGETGESGYFVLRPDAVQDSHIEAFESARGAVEAAWRAAKRREIARGWADSIIEATAGGGTLETAAASLGLSVTNTGPFTRSGSGLSGDLPADVASIAFEAPIGGVETTESDSAVVVVRVDRTEDPDPAAEDAARTRIGNELRAGLANDIVATLEEALRAEFAVEINRGFIDQTIRDQP